MVAGAAQEVRIQSGRKDQVTFALEVCELRPRWMLALCRQSMMAGSHVIHAPEWQNHCHVPQFQSDVA